MVETLDKNGSLLSIFLPGLEQGISLGDLPVNIRGTVRINQIQDRNPIPASDITVCLVGEEKVKFIKGHKHHSGGYRKKYKMHFQSFWQDTSFANFLTTWSQSTESISFLLSYQSGYHQAPKSKESVKEFTFR